MDGPLSPLPARYLSPKSSPALSTLALDDSLDDMRGSETRATPLQAVPPIMSSIEDPEEVASSGLVIRGVSEMEKGVDGVNNSVEGESYFLSRRNCA